MRPAAANLAGSQSLKFKAAAAAAADKWLLLSTLEVGEAAEAAVEAAEVHRFDALNEVRLFEMMGLMPASGLAEPMVESFIDPCEPPELAPGKQEVIVEAVEDGVTVIKPTLPESMARKMLDVEQI